jgi:hypothetical protein
MWEESIGLQQDMERESDREREDTERREGTKGETIVEKMMGKHFKDYFDSDDEQQMVYYWDAKYAI